MSDQSPPPHVELRHVGKRFQGAQALSDVSLSIQRGAIHALIGENGAGKSTLGKIIAGVIRPDEGELWVEGRRVNYRSPRDALADRITAIQQEIALVPQRTVLDNVFLGIEDERLAMVDNAELARRFEELNESSGFALDATARVSSLSIAEQQKVEIMRALARDSRLIVMDEPTARLSAEESQKLLGIVRQLQARGVTIVYVSHFLREVLAVADTITVLRNGEVIQTTPAATQTPDSLVTAMLGRAASLTFPERVRSDPAAPTLLSVRGLSRRGAFEDVSFAIRAGEIVGLTGLVGSGRSEVARAIFGADRLDRGTIELDGAPVDIHSPSDAIAVGIAMLPESRKDQGLHMRLPVGHNVTLPHLAAVSHAGILDTSKERGAVASLLERLAVKPPRVNALVSRLSGGNQQKVLFSKWLFAPPRALLLDEPTRGVDVGAKRALYELIVSLAASGMGVLLISSEIEEILGLSHRVLVMRRGRIVAEFAADDLDEEPILRAAFGSDPAELAQARGEA
jgi:simple sugar transport system ATP-binding protein/ribose transport system ATP-binding protein